MHPIKLVISVVITLVTLSIPVLIAKLAIQDGTTSEQFSRVLRRGVLSRLLISSAFFGIFAFPVLIKFTYVGSCFLCLTSHERLLFEKMAGGQIRMFCSGEMGEYLVSQGVRLGIAYACVYLTVSVAYITVGILLARPARRLFAKALWLWGLYPLLLYAATIGLFLYRPVLLAPAGRAYYRVAYELFPGISEFYFGGRPATGLLLSAVEQNDTDAARRYIRAGGQVNRAHLLYPIDYNNLEMVRLLAEHGADLNDGSGGRRTAVSAADLEIAEYLLSQGADPNGKGLKGRSELHRANGPRKAMLLLRYGADINGLDDGGRTPLMQAVLDGKLSLARVLVESGADLEVRDKGGWTALTLACSRAAKTDDRTYAANARLLLDHGANVNGRGGQGGTCLCWTIEAARLNDLTEYLFGHGADPNAADDAGDTPLIHAAMAKNTSGMALLLEHPGIATMDSAALDLLRRGITPDIRGLRRAVEHDDLASLGTLLEAGIDPNAEGDGARMLLVAVYRRDPAIVTALLEHGADPNRRKGDGPELATTPLIVATRRRDTAMVRVLLEHGADPDERESKYQRSALHFAARDGSEAIVELLVGRGAGVDIADYGGTTPQDMAVKSGHGGIAKRLREAAATR